MFVVVHPTYERFYLYKECSPAIDKMHKLNKEDDEREYDYEVIEISEGEKVEGEIDYKTFITEEYIHKKIA